MTAGIERRDDGWSAVQAADVAVNRNYADYVRAALTEFTTQGGPFTVDDIEHRAAELAPEGAHPHTPNLIPAIVGGWAAAKHIRITAYTHSTKPSRRHGRIGIYITTRQAA